MANDGIVRICGEHGLIRVWWQPVQISDTLRLWNSVLIVLRWCVILHGRLPASQETNLEGRYLSLLRSLISMAHLSLPSESSPSERQDLASERAGSYIGMDGIDPGCEDPREAEAEQRYIFEQATETGCVVLAGAYPRFDFSGEGALCGSFGQQTNSRYSLCGGHHHIPDHGGGNVIPGPVAGVTVGPFEPYTTRTMCDAVGMRPFPL